MLHVLVSLIQKSETGDEPVAYLFLAIEKRNPEKDIVQNTHQWISPCPSLQHCIQQRLLSRGRKDLDTVHSEGWQHLAVFPTESWCWHMLVDPLPSSCAHTCAVVSPYYGKGSKRLTKICCRRPVGLAAKYASLRREALWHVTDVICTQVMSSELEAV